MARVFFHWARFLNGNLFMGWNEPETIQKARPSFPHKFGVHSYTFIPIRLCILEAHTSGIVDYLPRRFFSAALDGHIPHNDLSALHDQSGSWLSQQSWFLDYTTITGPGLHKYHGSWVTQLSRVLGYRTITGRGFPNYHESWVTQPSRVVGNATLSRFLRYTIITNPRLHIRIWST